MFMFSLIMLWLLLISKSDTNDAVLTIAAIKQIT